MVEGRMRSRDLRLWRPRPKPKQPLNYGDQSKVGNEKENENESRRIRRAISEQQQHILEAIAKGGGGNHQMTGTGSKGHQRRSGESEAKYEG